MTTDPQTDTKTFTWEITGDRSALGTQFTWAGVNSAELIFEAEFGGRAEVGLDILSRSQDCTQAQEDALALKAQ